MFGCQCLYWNRLNHLFPPEPEPFSLPAPIPEWPPGEGFASGKISIGEIEVLKITRFELIWACTLPDDKKKCVAFYKPTEIPDGFHCVGYYSQDNGKPLHGYVLVAREVYLPGTADVREERSKSPALVEPLDYALQWSSDEGNEESFGSCGYFWLPQPPEGYKAMGFLVTNKPAKPELDGVRCVRADLTDTCETYSLLLNTGIKTPSLPFQVWTTRPRYRGMMENGVSVGTFFCSSYWSIGDDLQIGCLKNLNPKLSGMPNLDQIHSLINHYGPTVFFHPEEVYLPSSVAWFFKKGALLYKKDLVDGEEIDESGSILPGGGSNDGEFWIDLPTGDQRNNVIHGNLESAKLYAHVKPALGGTFTDIAMWVFCPFNGPGTLKIGFMDIALSKVGRHVGDWEHFTLRICNFSGELYSIYFSQHSGGEWVDAYALEYIHGNKAIVYSTKNGHASFPYAGTYLQGSAAIGIGIRNDAARSNFSVDSSIQYEVVAAEYLGDGVVTEPCWLQFMREWGPKIVYNSRTELEKVINLLPVMLRHPAKNIFAKLPVELSGEEGPTGPKEKNNWVGDERW